MLSWPAPLLPTLPGTGPVLKVHDTARGEVVATSPDPTARMYVCGITPYDATHLGHAATYLAFDLVNRVWRDAGHAVHYVQNVTDIDDPLLERADRDREDWIVLGMRETALFREDMTALRVLPAGGLRRRGRVDPADRRPHRDAARRRAWPTCWTTAPATSTTTSRRRPASAASPATTRRRCCGFFAERGGDPDRPGKRQPLDPMLWRGARPGEPSWPGPRGAAGRPGWHIECATIALDTIGMGFDVQGGGSDLVFPHHEYSAVHAEALTATKPFARAYVHAAMIGLDGEKMSKSRGNLVFVSKLRGDGVDPMAIRLALLSGHYRTDRAWTADLLQRGRGAAGHLAARGGAGRRRARGAAAGRAARAAVRRPGQPRARSRWSTTGRRAPSPATPDAEERGAARSSCDAVDALLGRRALGRTADDDARRRSGSPTGPPARRAEEQLAPAATRVARQPAAAPGPSRRTRCGRRSSATATGSCTPRRSAGSSTRRRSSSTPTATTSSPG